MENIEQATKNLIALIESQHSRAELYSDHQLKALYLELRASAYQLKNAPEAFQSSAPDLLRQRDELASALKDCLEQIDHLWDHLGSDKQRLCRPTTIRCQDQSRAALASVEKDGVEA